MSSNRDVILNFGCMPKWVISYILRECGYGYFSVDVIDDIAVITDDCNIKKTVKKPGRK
jgi:hypothetical protein